MVDIQELIKDTLAVGGGFAISGYTGAYVENTLIKTPVSATSSTTDKIMAYVANNAPKAILYFALHGVRTEFIQDVAKAAAGSIAVDSLARLGNQGVPVPIYFKNYRILSNQQQEQQLRQENLSLQTQLNDALQKLQTNQWNPRNVDRPIFNMPYEIDNAGSPSATERQAYFGSMSPKVTAMAPSAIPDSLSQDQRDSLFGMNQGIKTTTTMSLPVRMRYSEPIPESGFEGPIPSNIVPPYALENPNQRVLHDPSKIDDSVAKWVERPIFNTADRIPDYASREAYYGSMPFTNPDVLERQRYYGHMPFEQDNPKTSRQRRYGFSGDIQGMPFEQDPIKTARERKYGFASGEEPKYESLNQPQQTSQAQPSQQTSQAQPSQQTSQPTQTTQPVTALSIGML